MTLRETWLRLWSLSLAFTVSFGTLAHGAENIIVLVSGTKTGEASATPTKSQATNGGANPEATAVTTLEASATTVVKAAAPKKQLTELDKLVEEAIAATSRRYLTADVHTPWQIFHGLIALRHNFKLKVDGQKTSALEWIRGGRMHKGLPLVEQTPYGGRFHTFTEPYAFEGHPNQFMAILAMSELPRDFTFKAGKTGALVTVDDMLRNAQMECNDREEITWTLWLFARYFPTNTQWQDKYGNNWSMERLVQIQTAQRVQEGACGGCHGLFALSLARNAHLQSGQQLRGTWFEADQKIKRFVAETKAMQNLHIDGSFSSNHYNGPGYESDFTKRIAASGHILEWLMIGLDNNELQQPWLQRGVESVARDLVMNRQAPADCGPLYHALHSLVLYRQRTRPDVEDATLVEAPAQPAVAPAVPATPAKDAALNYTEPKRVEPKVVNPAPANTTPMPSEVKGPAEPPMPTQKTPVATQPEKPAASVKPETVKPEAVPLQPMPKQPEPAAVSKEAAQPKTADAEKVDTSKADKSKSDPVKADAAKPDTEKVLPLFGTGKTEPAKSEAQTPKKPQAEPVVEKPVTVAKPVEKVAEKPVEKPVEKPAATTTEKPKKDDNDEFDSEFQVPLPPTDD